MGTLSGTILVNDRLGSGTTNTRSQPNGFIAEGSQIAAGRVVVLSPLAIRSQKAGAGSGYHRGVNYPCDDPTKLFAADGKNYTDAGLDGEMKMNGKWIVVGVTKTAGACHDRCIATAGWPYTPTQEEEINNYYAVGSVLDLVDGGEVRMQVGSDVTPADPVTVYVTPPTTAGDPKVMGAVGVDGQITMLNWRFLESGKAGDKVMVKIEGTTHA